MTINNSVQDLLTGNPNSVQIKANFQKAEIIMQVIKEYLPLSEKDDEEASRSS